MPALVTMRRELPILVLLRINAKIYMPISTPKQKIKQVELFGRENIEIILCGETYDDAYAAAQQDASDNNKVLFT